MEPRRYLSMILLLFAVLTKGEESNMDNELPVTSDFRPEIFYDNKVLPENTEVTVFIFKHETYKLFFLHEKNHRPLSITVTPCSASVDWSLTLRDFPAVSRVINKDLWLSHRSPPPVFQSGFERRTHIDRRAPAGLYVLELTSRDGDTSAKVFVSTTPEGSSPYPPLPSDPQVDVLRARKGRVLIAWKASPTRTKVDYCVSVNPRKNYPTFCSLWSEMHGDIPEPPPPSTGFGFWWERDARKRHLMKAREIHKKFEAKTDVFLQCVGEKTWHVFHQLDESKTHFLDVFALDPAHNTSTAYVGTTVTTRGQTSSSKVRENVMIPLSLSQAPVHLEYAPPTSTHAVWVFLQSCSGLGPLHLLITVGDKELMSVDVMDAKSLLLLDPPNGTLAMTVSSRVQTPRKAMLLISRKYYKYPFPTLPDNKRVQVFDTLTTCDSVTIAWRATRDDKVRYCVFRHQIQNAKWHITARPLHHFCDDPEDGSTVEDRGVKILCRRYHRFSRNRFNDVIIQRVHGLHPETTYVFEVQVTKFRGKTLPYEQVWVTTRKTCSQVHSKR